jgi:multidrug resistance efflux pump
MCSICSTRAGKRGENKAGPVAQQEVDDGRQRSGFGIESGSGDREIARTAQSEVAVAQAKLVHDQALYDIRKITAPFDGVVTQRFANWAR